MNEEQYKPYEGRRPFTFISYSRSNPIVLETIKALQDKGYRIWFDDGIHGGESWSDEIVKRIKKATAFVIFLSKESVKSRNVQSEMSLAFKMPETLKIIPIWIHKPCELDSNMEYFLSAIQVCLTKTTGPVSVEELVNELDPVIPDSTRNTSEIEDGVLLRTQDDIHDLLLGQDIVEIGPRACKGRVNLKKVVFSNNLKVIGDEAFRGCTAITELKVNKSVTRIGDSCFRDCTALTRLDIDEEIEIGERAFENCGNLVEVNLPDDLAEIYSGVFNSCRELKSITLPKQLIAIGDNAFAHCDSLQEVVIPPHVVRIDDQVFSGCLSLSKVTLSDSVSRLGKNVFKDCVNLKSIFITRNVVKIESGCFRGCSSFEEIEIHPRNRYFKSMNGVLYNKNKSVLICYPCAKKDDIFVVPDSVSYIEDWAFANANNLKVVRIPDSVEKIGEGAFFRCQKLEEVHIPYSVSIIQDTAFRGCINLKDVYIENPSFKELGWGLFYRCDKLTIHCVSREVEEYCRRLNIKCVRYNPED